MQLLSATSFVTPSRPSRICLQVTKHWKSSNRQAFGNMSATIKNEECGAVNAIKEAMAVANLKEPPRVILDKCESKNASNDNLGSIFMRTQGRLTFFSINYALS